MENQSAMTSPIGMVGKNNHKLVFSETVANTYRPLLIDSDPETLAMADIANRVNESIQYTEGLFPRGEDLMADFQQGGFIGFFQHNIPGNVTWMSSC